VSLTCAQPDRYNVCVFHDALKISLAQDQYLHEDDGYFYVTFSSPEMNARLPDCRLLTLHAVCARVVLLSGATLVIIKELKEEELKEDIVDELEQDIEETIVL